MRPVALSVRMGAAARKHTNGKRNESPEHLNGLAKNSTLSFPGCATWQARMDPGSMLRIAPE
jgi:hypothetical protein